MEIGEAVATPSQDSSDDEDSRDDLQSLVVRIIDQDGNVVSGAPYQLQLGGQVRQGTTGSDGCVRENDLRLPGRARFAWGYPPKPGELPEDPPELQFETVLYLNYKDSDDEDPDEGARQRLNNLAYPGEDFAADISAFQLDFGIPAADWFDQATWDKLRSVHDSE